MAYQTINGVTPTGVNNAGQFMFDNVSPEAAQGYMSTTGGTPQGAYAYNQTQLSNQTAAAAAAQKTAALQQAWQTNQQALNSQNATVQNNYQTAADKLTALQQARDPQYQTQRDQTSSDAASQLRQTQAINALGGKYFSGVNRDQMLNVDLARQNSLQGIQTSQNAFNTDTSNQLNEADAARVAALNDIASKISLGQQQVAQGTYNINSQLASDQATGALKASADAQTWADAQKQQGIDNTARQTQMDNASNLAALQQAFQQKQFDATQENDATSQSLQRAQLMGSLDGTNTMAKDAQLADQAYKNATLASSNANAAASRAVSAAKSSGSSSVTQSSPGGVKNNYDAQSEVDNQIRSGTSPGNVAYSVEQQRAALTKQGINVDALIKYVWSSAGVETTPSQL